jgi:hypothetical protein
MHALKTFIAALIVSAFLSFPALAHHDGTCETVSDVSALAQKYNIDMAYSTKDPMRIDMLREYIEDAPTGEETGRFVVYEKSGSSVFGAYWFDKNGCKMGEAVIPEIIMQMTVGSEWRNVGGF